MINSFPGYEWVYSHEDKQFHNMFKGEDVGKGGYVWHEPGMYGRTMTFDVRGMHPSSIIAMNYFGEYTSRYKELVEARAAIKHKDFETASKMLDGKLAPYLTDPGVAKSLSNALKLAQNSCYGLTAANFDNPMRHPRNDNNIVALRGALFMVTLKEEVIKRGGKPIHCKTDSIKVVEPTEELIEFIMNFGIDYGYEFEVEHIFEKICLVNKSTYVAKLAHDDPDSPGEWTATAAQFQVPYVFKKLFTKDPITFDDMCETKEVTSAMYLDMNETLPEGEHNYRFVGKVGSFCPIKPGCGGGELVRAAKSADGEKKLNAVTGTTGFRWMEAEMVKELGKQDDVDISYYTKLVDDAVTSISKFGDFEWFAE